jgi:hypothetical protein
MLGTVPATPELAHVAVGAVVEVDIQQSQFKTLLASGEERVSVAPAVAVVGLYPWCVMA